MKTQEIILSLLFLLFALTSLGQNGFNGISIEEVPIPEPAASAVETILPNAKCYRVYACVDSEFELQFVFGNDEFPLSINTSGTFFQSFVGGPTSLDINEAVITLFPDLEYDSFVTIGALSSADNLLEVVSPDPNWDSGFELGGELLLNSGIATLWFIDPAFSTSQNRPDENGRILLAQFTTDGVISGQMNLQLRELDENGDPVLPINLVEVTSVPIDSTPGVMDLSCETLVDFPGCTIAIACNYDPLATIYDDSCEVDSCLGCTYQDALNFDTNASIDDGTCEYPCTGDLNADGVVTFADVLTLLGAFGQSCF